MTNLHPIIMSAHSVSAILAGTKTQTRRVIKPQYPHIGLFIENGAYAYPTDAAHMEPSAFVRCPYGGPGDRLWVRETWAVYQLDGIAPGTKEFPNILYKADSSTRLVLSPTVWQYNKDVLYWRSPMYMPHWAKRLTLEIINVHAERVQAISSDDLDAEGFQDMCHCGDYMKDHGWTNGHGGVSTGQAEDEFSEAWDNLNAKRGYSWASNPWVWVIEFRKV